MPTNDFLPFCSVDTGTNLEEQAEYAADPQLLIGNQPGLASAQLVNKALRQATYVASQVAQVAADLTNTSLLDNQATGVIQGAFTTLWQPNNIGLNMGSTGLLGIADNMPVSGLNTLGLNMGTTGVNAIANNRTRATGSSTEPVGGIPISASCGEYNTTSTTFTPITNLSVTLTTAGRAVQVFLQADGVDTTVGSIIGIVSTNGQNDYANYALFRGSTQIALYTCQSFDPNLGYYIPSSIINFLDIGVNGSPGTYTYTLKIKIVIPTPGDSYGYCYFATFGAREV